MVNYAVDDWTSSVGTLKEVGAEIETELETIDSTKTIHLLQVVEVGGGGTRFQAILIIDAT